MRVDGGADEKELADYLATHPPLRGRIQLVADQQRTGGISQSVATVLVEVGPAAVTAFGGALVTWLRHRTANTRVTVRRPDGTRFELSAQRVRGLGAPEVTELVKQLSDALTDPKP
jgi:Effector Associated Constant Component 1